VNGVVLGVEWTQAAPFSLAAPLEEQCCRVSSKEQIEGTSLESQELACRKYARQNGMNESRRNRWPPASSEWSVRPDWNSRYAYWMWFS